MDPDVLRTFAAAADTILPGSSAAGVHVHVAQLFDAAMEGYPVMVAGLLDAFAGDVRAGTSFASLSDRERGEVLEVMMADDSVDVRDVVDGLFIFTLGQNYSEAHPDHAAIWERIGYHGPSEGVPDFA